MWPFSSYPEVTCHDLLQQYDYVIIGEYTPLSTIAKLLIGRDLKVEALLAAYSPTGLAASLLSPSYSLSVVSHMTLGPPGSRCSATLSLHFLAPTSSSTVSLTLSSVATRRTCTMGEPLEEPHASMQCCIREG